MRGNHLTSTVLLSCLTIGVVLSDPGETRLMNDVFQSYDVRSRPVGNSSHTLKVDIDFEVRTILDFDEQNQFITVVGLRTLKWTDAYLKWSARQYDGIRRLHFDPERIWKPDIVLINAAAAPVPIHRTSLLVSNKGEVNFMSPFIYKSLCKTKLNNDVQKCLFEFSSWTYSGDEIDLRMSTRVIDVSRFVPHHVWALEPTSASRKEVSFPCCTEVYPKITYTLNLARRPPPANSKNATDNNNLPKSSVSQIYSSYQLMFSSLMSLSILSTYTYLSDMSS